MKVCLCVRSCWYVCVYLCVYVGGCGLVGEPAYTCIHVFVCVSVCSYGCCVILFVFVYGCLFMLAWCKSVYDLCVCLRGCWFGRISVFVCSCVCACIVCLLVWVLVHLRVMCVCMCMCVYMLCSRESGCVCISSYARVCVCSHTLYTSVYGSQKSTLCSGSGAFSLLFETLSLIALKPTDSTRLPGQ